MMPRYPFSSTKNIPYSQLNGKTIEIHSYMRKVHNLQNNMMSGVLLEQCWTVDKLFCYGSKLTKMICSIVF